MTVGLAACGGGGENEEGARERNTIISVLRFPGWLA
jgi:hypothetical protein